jgi:hypothetical protein
MIRLITIKITDRIKEAGLTQEILSRHASVITTRLGFHELTSDVCSREACIILHLNGEGKPVEELLSDLDGLEGIEVSRMDFEKTEDNSIGHKGGKNRILGILTERRHDAVIAVQKLLTSYGCVIRTRLGVNETFFGRPAGLIILELKGDEHQMDLLEDDLGKLNGVHLRKVVF